MYEQINGILKDADTGGTTVGVCHRHRISLGNFCPWGARLGGMGAGETQWPRQLEE